MDINEVVRELKKNVTSLEAKSRSLSRKIDACKKEIIDEEEICRITETEYKKFIKNPVISMNDYLQYLQILEITQSKYYTKKIELNALQSQFKAVKSELTTMKNTLKDAEKELNKWGRIIEFPRKITNIV